MMGTSYLGKATNDDGVIPGGNKASSDDLGSSGDHVDDMADAHAWKGMPGVEAANWERGGDGK
jgi:hypothetical protein